MTFRSAPALTAPNPRLDPFFIRSLVQPEAARRYLLSTSRALEAAPPATIEVQLSLFGDLPVQPPDPFGTGFVVRLAREQGGLSQADLAARLGLRDRSHVANVERGHDRLSLSRRRLLCRIIETDRLAA